MSCLSRSDMDLPPEIVRQVVLHVCHLAPGLWKEPWSETKRGLAACSLTCRFWAAIVRPSLFGSLDIRSPEDLDTLTDFLDFPAPLPGVPISDLIRTITIVHPLCALRASVLLKVQALLKRLSLEPAVGLTIVDPGVFAGRSARPIPPSISRHSPFSDLPKTLPWKMLPLHSLTLEKVQIQRKIDVVRMLDSLPDITRITLQEVTFVDKSPITRGPRRRPSALSYVDVKTHEHIEDQILSASDIFASQRQVPGDFDAWAAGLALLPADLRACGSASLLRDINSKHSVLCFHCLGILTKLATLSLLALEQPEFTHRSSARRDRSRLHDEVSLDLVVAPERTWLGVYLCPEEHQPLPSLQWNALDEALSCVPRLSQIFMLVSGPLARTLLRVAFETILQSPTCMRIAQADGLYVSCADSRLSIPNRYLRSGEILSVPSHITRHGETVSLSPAMQAEWLLLPDAAARESHLSSVWKASRAVSPADSPAPGLLSVKGRAQG